MIQLDLFQTYDVQLEAKLRTVQALADKTKDSNDRVRKCQFAKIGELAKMCRDLDERMKIIERHICNGR